MDRIALISDIHGNMPALEATLQDIGRRAISRIFCLGDLVGKGPHPERVVDLCKSTCERVIKGNWDDMIGDESGKTGRLDGQLRRWHQDRLGAAQLAYLRDLPAVIEFWMSGKRVRLFHASQKGIFDRVHMYGTREEHQDMFVNTAFTGGGDPPDVVGCGDIHAAYVKSFQNRILFNTGSVGNALDGTQASYAIIEGRFESNAEDIFGIQLVRVPYDIEQAIQQAAEEDMPELDAYANELRTGKYRGSSG